MGFGKVGGVPRIVTMVDCVCVCVGRALSVRSLVVLLELVDCSGGRRRPMSDALCLSDCWSMFSALETIADIMDTMELSGILFSSSEILGVSICFASKSP